jgi:predicted glutamine amidotransferase
MFASIRVQGEPSDRSALLQAFFAQSRLHPDGWGMARFSERGPEVVKEPVDASQSAVLARCSGWSREPLLLAHIRKGSVGGRTMENTHPFLLDGWVFEHNGTIDVLDQVLARLSPASRSRLRGGTDSEAFFLLMVQSMEETGDPVEGIAGAVRFLHEIRGPQTTALNFIMCDGRRIYLLNSAFVRADYYALHCLPDEDGKGMTFASRPLHQDRGWSRLEKHTLLVVDRELNVQRHPMA